MASLFPFRALRYASDRVRLENVLTQPYDKITPAMQERYYAASPYNLVRIELGNSRLEPGGDVYAAAAAHLGRWRAEGILRQDAAASIYAYSQRFAVPGSERAAERRGFIALGQLEDYDRGIVFRHEQTHSGPKADRLNLLRATRAHSGQLFMLYSDPAKAVDRLLLSDRKADVEITDEFGVVHRLWAIADASVIAQVQALMAEQKLIIADGHHRYETALTYRDERRSDAASNTAPELSAKCANAPYERVMMTFVNMDAEGLVILPTHRVVHSLAMFDAEQLLRGALRYFDIDPLPREVDARGIHAALAGTTAETGLVAFTGERNVLLKARREALAALLPELSPQQRELDVVALHRVLLEKILGISEVAIREQRNVAYTRDAGEAIARVRSSQADAAFLMNAVRIEQMRDIAFAGGVLPQKSTDFYPKLLSGLAIYAME
ncbi:MAG: DUF1015 domain-containing protein [Acidobacteriota bacterium]|nr:DUF1015 domain-containing protein [Acidobacteriota bacterium]